MIRPYQLRKGDIFTFTYKDYKAHILLRGFPFEVIEQFEARRPIKTFCILGKHITIKTPWKVKMVRLEYLWDNIFS